MSKRCSASLQGPPNLCFVEELAGETPPSFAAMQRLYGLASDLFALLPWRMLDESQFRDSASDELCYCSVMGALGEVLPTEVHVRSQKLKDSLDQLIRSLGVKLHVASRLPAADQARAHLLAFLQNES